MILTNFAGTQLFSTTMAPRGAFLFGFATLLLSG